MEPDAALGNGGLGRLAACFMESMASLGSRPTATAFATTTACSSRSSATAGSTNIPENWLSFGNPWEFPRPEISYEIGFGGQVDAAPSPTACGAVWRPAETVDAVAYDTPVVGWRGRHVNTLRLWSARAPDPLRARRVQPGRSCRRAGGAGARRMHLQVLYPSDSTPAGQELRLRQEYFFASASLQDLLRRHIRADTATSATSPTRWRSSSTTPIRRSASPN